MSNKMDKITSRMISKITIKLEKINSIQKISVKSCGRGIRFKVDGGLIGWIEIVNDDKRGMEVNFLPYKTCSFYEMTLFGFKGSYTFDDWAFSDLCGCDSRTDYSMFPVTSYSQLETKSIDYMIQKILENDGKYVIKCNQSKQKAFRGLHATL